MNRYLIHVSTDWCGMDQTYRAEAESEMDLWEIADQLAYENFQEYGCDSYIAEEWGYDPEDMEDEDWEELWTKTEEGDYYSSYVEKFSGDNKEWEEYPWA